MSHAALVEILGVHIQDEVSNVLRGWAAGEITGRDFGGLLEILVSTLEHIDEVEKLSVVQALAPFKRANNVAREKARTLKPPPLSKETWSMIKGGLKSL